MLECASVQGAQAGELGGGHAIFDALQRASASSPLSRARALHSRVRTPPCALGSSATSTPISRRSPPCSRRTAPRRIDVYYCLGDTVGYGGSPNECADLVRETAKKTILGNHDAAVSGRMDYSYYYEAARHALDAHAATLSEVNMAWLKSLPYQEKLEDADVLLCHGSPVRLEEFEYIFAPEQARECLSIWDRIGHITLIGHSHLCKVFALTPTQRRGAARDRLQRSTPDKKYIVSVGSVGPAARLRQPRELHGLRHRQEALRVQAHRVRHRARGRQGPARAPRAQLRAPPLHRRLECASSSRSGSIGARSSRYRRTARASNADPDLVEVPLRRAARTFGPSSRGSRGGRGEGALPASR